jgi:hypothetical protein
MSILRRLRGCRPNTLPRRRNALTTIAHQWRHQWATNKSPDLWSAWNLANRPISFVGYPAMLSSIRSESRCRDRLLVHAFYGVRGAGKTALALEYAHRFASDYEIIWWVSADEVGSIPDQMVELARALDLEISSTTTAVLALRRVLRSRARWLLIFDGAEDLDSVRDWLPDGRGHVIVTSRRRQWEPLSVPILVDGLPPDDCVELICGQLGSTDRSKAAQLAEQLGGLPMAITQAVAYLQRTGTSVEELLERRPSSYPLPLIVELSSTAERLKREAPVALCLALATAFLAPVPVTKELLMGMEAESDGPLGALVGIADSEFYENREKLASVGWAQIDGKYLAISSLARAVLQDRLSESEKESVLSSIEATLLLAAPAPDEITEKFWHVWEQLHPHVLAARPGDTKNPLLRAVAADLARYLLYRNDLAAASEVADELFRLGEHVGPPEELNVAAEAVADVWHALGRFDDAARLYRKVDVARKIN